MAKRVETLFTDDLDDSPADATVAYSLEGVDYEIDLSAKNRSKFYDALANYVEHSRRVSKAKPVRARRAPKAVTYPDKPKAAKSNGKSDLSKEDRAAIRAWGKANGWDALGDRGRLPAALIEAYLATT